ncbi:hypothetical protein J2794_005066 [Paraburkholderia terricola]|uniref:hypothetical protein n=1 Tax=Paraburkholderia terricola TaxID=169427 RepID=UPI00285E5123|nr:hypothetical protein [Paraburkholderia terricola]MDR6448935.1 hypothetical protein [Paraburkholderia terricola]
MRRSTRRVREAGTHGARGGWVDGVFSGPAATARQALGGRSANGAASQAAGGVVFA